MGAYSTMCGIGEADSLSSKTITFKKGQNTMNEITIRKDFAVNEMTEAAIKRLTNKNAIKSAHALALDIADFNKTLETAGKVVSDKATPLSKSLAIQLSIIAETEKFGKKEAYKGIGEFAEEAFGMKSAFTSNHVGVGRFFYRVNNPTAATAIEWYGTVSMLSKFLPLRKLSKDAFPYSVIEDAFNSGDLTQDSTQKEIEEWVKSKLPVIEKPEITYDCVLMPGGERVNNTTWDNYAAPFGEGANLCKVSLKEGEKLVDEDGTPWEVVVVIRSDYGEASIVWRHKHKEPKGVSPVKITQESTFDKVKRLLGTLSPDEIAELLASDDT